MTTPYLLLSQLAADYRRRGMTETADLCDREHEQLAERFGALERFGIPPRAPWLQDYVRRLEQYRARAERGDQYGRVNHAVALACTITVSLLAQAVREGLQLTPRDAEQLTDTARRATAAAYERIDQSAGAEAGLARLSSIVGLQARQRQFLRQQEQARAVAELAAAKARVEALVQ